MTPDTPPLTQEFFEKRQAAAVLKHAILTAYLTPWAAKTGSTSLDHRVAVGDCYAGSGRYADGSPGSPAIIAGLAQQPGLRNRQVEAYFIEADLPTYQQLRRVLSEDAAAIRWQAWHGTANEHVDELLARTQGVPLFLFLDPYGHGLSCDRIMTALNTRPRHRGAPPTEALIRIDSAAVYRTRGVLRADSYPGRDAQLHRLDLTAGGPWWREVDPSLDTEAYLGWFTGQLLQRMCRQGNWLGWTVPVRRKARRVPVYYLLFLTRHPDGMAVFNESLSLATAQWRRRILELGFEDSLLSGYVEETFTRQEAELADEWCGQLEYNLITFLDQVPSFVVIEQLEHVFAGVLGLAREKHLRAVLKQFHDKGITATDAKGKLYSKRIRRA